MRRRHRRLARSGRRVSEAALLAALFFCPWALGGVAPWALWTLLALSAVALAGVTADAFFARRRLTGSLSALALGAMALAVGLQCVPLPPALLARLAPASDDLFRFTLGPRGLYPAWRPLSLDPAATAVELAKALAYLGLFLSASHLCRAREVRRRLAMAVALLGASIAGSAFLHQLFGLNLLFGFDKLHRPGLVSPFVDRNHLASILELSALVQLGLAVRTRDQRRAFAWGLAFLFTGAAVVLSGSRAGAISFLAGGLVFGALVWLKGQQGDGSELLRHRLALGACFLVGVLGVAIFLNADQLLASLESLQDVPETHALPKIWPTVMPMVREHWLTGVGRGAFATTFPHYQQGFAETTFTHPENVLLQLTSELGLVLGLGLLVVLSFAWAQTARRADLSPAEGGLLAALFAVGLHEFADFGLELSGIAVPALVALAVAVTRPAARRRVPRQLGLALLLALVGAGTWGLSHTAHLAPRDRAQVQQALHGGTTAQALEAVWSGLERHPSDYVLPLDAALAMARARPPQPEAALFWAGRAMYLAPISPWAHRIAAESLFLRGARQQALLEEQQAAPAFINDFSFRDDLRRFLRSPEDWVAVVPATPEGAKLVLELTAFDPALSLRAGQLAFDRLHLELPDLLMTLADRAAQAGDRKAALALARRAEVAAPGNAEALMRVADHQAALGDPVEAETTLRAALKLSPGNLGVSMRLASLLTTRKQYDEAHRLLRQVSTADPRQRVTALDQDANVWRAQGMDTQAIAALRDAAALVPDDPNRQYALASLFLSLGRTREALAAIDRGLGIDHTDGRTGRATWRADIAKKLDTEEREALFKKLDRQSKLQQMLDEDEKKKP